MKFKKIMSTALASVLALSLSTPALADDVKVEGSISLPTINVVLPTTASMILNPYGLEVSLTKGADPVKDQIVSPVMQVKNLSDIGIKVDISVAGTKNAKGGADFTEEKTSGDGAATGKVANVVGYFKIVATEDLAEFALPDSYTAGDTAGTVQVLVPEGTDSAAEVKGFEAATAADKDNRTNVLAPSADKKNPDAEAGTLAFTFGGSAVAAPVKEVNNEDVSDPWTDKDTLGATVAFTFTPVPGDVVDTTAP